MAGDAAASASDFLARTLSTADYAEYIALHTRATDRPACGSAASVRGYNTPIHVFALFLILALSTLACSFPLIVRRFPHLPVPNTALFLSRHFGTGVLIATAFVHLLPTAYTSLTDPCLPPFWNKTYPAFAGFVTMISVMVVVAIEMFFASQGAAHDHSLDLNTLMGTSDSPRTRRPSGTFRPLRMTNLTVDATSANEMHVQKPPSSPYSDEPGSKDKPLPAPPPDDSGDEEEDLNLEELDPNSDEAGLLGGKKAPAAARNGSPVDARPRQGSRSVSFAEPLHSPGAPPTPSGQTSLAHQQRLVLQCLMLEAGILFHSVFIGMALSVSTGSAFVVLLIAISFHQTFEGLALGSRIAGIPSFSTQSMKPWLMSLMYGVTTPIGQAIGLAVHTLYDPASQFGLLMVGIVNAISSGLLIYAGLVQLLAEDFLSDQSYHDLRGRKRLEACGMVVLGALLMAFVGAFA